MRLWHFALIAMILVPVGVTPAVASGTSFQTHHMHLGVFFGRSHWLSRFNNFNNFSNFSNFNRFSSFDRFSRFDRNRSLGLADNPSFGLFGGGFLGVSADCIGNPGFVVVAAPTSAPVRMAMSRPVTEERPTVETTASGVTIIRGPGSHHLTP